MLKRQNLDNINNENDETNEGEYTRYHFKVPH